MKVLFNKKFLLHNVDSNAEGAYRIIEFPEHFEDTDFNGEEYITLVHSENYKNMIREACMHNDYAAEVFLSPESYAAAISAVGLTVKAAGQGDFAVVRPPGHHAGKEKTMGFCIFNNIAIAAQKLINEGKKVFILDIDAHHGNGTQEIFYSNNKLFYCSIHQSFSFPHTGQANEIGIGIGKAYTRNLPLMLGSGDKEFLSAIEKSIEIARKFDPDIVGISAGFDGYYMDRMMNFDYSLKGYYECGFKLGRAFKNIFAVLEGGYHNDIYPCVTNFVEGINVGSRPIKNRFDYEMSIG